jgi:hypothetical protein
LIDLKTVESKNIEITERNRSLMSFTRQIFLILNEKSERDAIEIDEPKLISLLPYIVDHLNHKLHSGEEIIYGPNSRLIGKEMINQSKKKNLKGDKSKAYQLINKESSIPINDEVPN